MGPVVVKKEVKEEIYNPFDMDFKQGTIMIPINMKEEIFEETVTETKENCKQEKNTEAMDDSDDDVPLSVRLLKEKLNLRYFTVRNGGQSAGFDAEGGLKIF